MHPSVIDLVCRLYVADKEKLVKQPKQEKQIEPAETVKPDLEKRMEALEAMVKDIIEQIHKPDTSENLKNEAEIKLTYNEKALLLLKNMMFSGGCEIADFKSKAGTYKIPFENIEYAIKFAKDNYNWHIQTSGYGANKKTWLRK